jgi:hypothetical protein
MRVLEEPARWSGCVRRALLFAATTACAVTLVASSSPESVKPGLWEGRLQLSPMPGCDLGPYMERRLGYFELALAVRMEGSALTVALPHSPDLAVSYVGRRAILAFSGDIQARLKSGTDVDASEDITLTCMRASGRDPIPLDRVPLTSEVRQERLQFKGDLTPAGKPSELKLVAKVTPCPENSCSVAVTVKLKKAPAAAPSS